MSIHPDTQRAFEVHVGAYIEEECSELPLIEHKELRSLLPWKDLEVVCIGCGGGDECAFFIRHGAKSVLGVEPSHALTEIARLRHPGIEFKTADFETLKYQPKTADVIYCAHVLHYLPEWRESLAVAKQLLRDGGHLLITLHHPLEWALSSSSFIQQPRYLSIESVRAKFFGSCEVVYYPRPISLMLNAFAEAKLKLVSCSEPKPDNSEVPLFVSFLLQA